MHALRVLAAGPALLLAALLFGVACSLPLRLRSASIGAIEVDGFDATALAATSKGGDGGLVEAAVLGTRFVLAFNQPLPGSSDALAGLLELHCAAAAGFGNHGGGHSTGAGGAGRVPTVSRAIPSSEPAALDAVVAVVSKRQFDANQGSGGGEGGGTLGCRPLADAGTSAYDTARAWRRAYHVLNAFGDVHRRTAPHELRLYAVNLRALPNTHSPPRSPPPPPVSGNASGSSHSGGSSSSSNNNNTTNNTATLLHLRALTAAREEVQCQLGLRVDLLDGALHHGGHAGNASVSTAGFSDAAPSATAGGGAGAVSSPGSFDEASAARAAVSGPDPLGLRQAVSFLVAPPSGDDGGAEDGARGGPNGTEHDGVPTVELPYGGCVFLEESAAVGAGAGAGASAGAGHETFAASAAAAAAAAEEHMKEQDAHREAAMQGLLRRIELDRAAEKQEEAQEEAAAAGAGGGKMRRKRRSSSMPELTPEAAQDAAEKIPQMMQAALTADLAHTMHPPIGVVPTSLLALESSHHARSSASAGTGVDAGVSASLGMATDLASAGAAGRGVITATGQYLSAVELEDLMGGLSAISLIMAPIMIMISAAMAPIMDEIVESTGERVSQNVKNSVGAFVPSDTAMVASAAMTYQLSAILPDMVTALLAPAMSKRLVDQLAPYLHEMLSEDMNAHLPEMLRAGVEGYVERALTHRLPPLLEFSLSIQLLPTLTHTITHALVPVVAKALSYDGEQSEACRVCFYRRTHCERCHFSSKDNYYLNYYATYYSDYYSDYYAKYYGNAALQYQLSRNNPDAKEL